MNMYEKLYSSGIRGLTTGFDLQGDKEFMNTSRAHGIVVVILFIAACSTQKLRPDASKTFTVTVQCEDTDLSTTPPSAVGGIEGSISIVPGEANFSRSSGKTQNGQAYANVLSYNVARELICLTIKPTNPGIAEVTNCASAKPLRKDALVEVATNLLDAKFNFRLDVLCRIVKEI